MWRLGLTGCSVSENSQKILVIVGPTASGKSQLALQWASLLNGAIVNCDSVQLYRGFDIGSAKPSLLEQKVVPHFLIDCLDAHEDCDARQYAQLATAAIEECRMQGLLPIVTGGTGLYLRALWGQQWHTDLPKDLELREELAQLSNETLLMQLQSLDPERAKQLHPNDRYRLERALEIVILTGKPLAEQPAGQESPLFKESVVIVMTPERAALHGRIAQRVDEMLDQGLVDEVRGLLAQGVEASCKPMQSIGYRQVAAMLAGEINAAEMREQIVEATRQYAKRQDTWFRKVEAHFRLPHPSQGIEIFTKLKQQLGIVS